jgi:hypothetical protein
MIANILSVGYEIVVQRVNPERVRAPTTKAVGSNFVKCFEPTALVVGLRTSE